MICFPAEMSLGGTPYPKLHQVALLLVCLCISMVIAPGGIQHASEWVMVLCAVKHLEWSLRIQKFHIKTVHIPSTLEFGKEHNLTSDEQFPFMSVFIPLIS